MKSFLDILNIISYGTTIIVVFAFLVGIYKWATGISPALWRLGRGLSSRKIAVFAVNDDFNSIRSLLVDSGLFQERNVIQITGKELKKAEKFSLYLAHWKSMSGHLDAILSEKKDGTALVIYAPQEEGHIPKEDWIKINQHRNVIVANLRGRLLNDIVTSLITTSYDR